MTLVSILLCDLSLDPLLKAVSVDELLTAFTLTGMDQGIILPLLGRVFVPLGKADTARVSWGLLTVLVVERMIVSLLSYLLFTLDSISEANLFN